MHGRIMGIHTVVLSCENAPHVPQAVEVGEGVRHGGRDRSHGQEAGKQLRGPHCAASKLNSTRGCGSRACEKAEGCGAEMWCGAGSATRACWRVNKHGLDYASWSRAPFPFPTKNERLVKESAVEGRVKVRLRCVVGVRVSTLRTCWRKGWLVHTGGVPSEAYMN